MSAYPEVISMYLDELVQAALSVPEDWETLLDRRERIMENYRASLNETKTYHRYFTQLRDGEGGWAREMEKARARIAYLEKQLEGRTV